MQEDVWSFPNHTVDGSLVFSPLQYFWPFVFLTVHPKIPGPTALLLLFVPFPQYLSLLLRHLRSLQMLASSGVHSSLSCLFPPRSASQLVLFGSVFCAAGFPDVFRNPRGLLIFMNKGGQHAHSCAFADVEVARQAFFSWQISREFCVSRQDLRGRRTEKQ